MKKLFLLLTVLLVTACNEEQYSYCKEEIIPTICKHSNPEKVELYKFCLEQLAGMRGSQGGDYTTHDDEDIDHAIRQCQRSAYYTSGSGKKVCEPNPEYVAQQEHCNETIKQPD